MSVSLHERIGEQANRESRPTLSVIGEAADVAFASAKIYHSTWLQNFGRVVNTDPLGNRTMLYNWPDTESPMLPSAEGLDLPELKITEDSLSPRHDVYGATWIATIQALTVSTPMIIGQALASLVQNLCSGVEHQLASQLDALTLPAGQIVNGLSHPLGAALGAHAALRSSLGGRLCPAGVIWCPEALREKACEHRWENTGITVAFTPMLTSYAYLLPAPTWGRVRFPIQPGLNTNMNDHYGPAAKVRFMAAFIAARSAVIDSAAVVRVSFTL